MMRGYLAIACAVLLGSSALAQETFTGGPAAGKNELSISGSFTFGRHLGAANSVVSSSPAGTCSFLYGHYLTRNLELDLDNSLMFDTNGDLFSVTTAPSAYYHFLSARPSRLVPFVGGGVLASYQTQSLGPRTPSGITFGLGTTGGVKYFVSNDVALRFQVVGIHDFGTKTYKAVSFVQFQMGVGAMF